MRVVVWGENVHEREEPAVRAIYPDGMHETIAAGLRAHLPDAAVATATFQEPEHGLGAAVLETADVLVWWGHRVQEDVDHAVVARVRDRVLRGMGLLVLHSAAESKLFRSLMSTTCGLRWRRQPERELVWTVAPGHPIAAGVPEVFAIPQQEVYGEFFDIPPPDELVFISSFPGGEVFRSGCCFTRGWGRVFYFSPGDQAYPVYHQAEVRTVLANAVRWACPPHGVRDQRYRSQRSPAGWYEGA